MEKSNFSVSKATSPADSVENLSLSFSNLQLNNGGNLSLSSNALAVFEKLKLGPIETVFLAENEQGYQYLQESLSLGDPRIVGRIFYALFGYLIQVMCDKLGHHVFAKLVKSCSDHQLRLITKKITSQDDLFLKVSLNTHGSSSMKRLINVVSRPPNSPLLDLITSALQRLFQHMMITKSGSSIISFCLQTLNDHQNDKIYSAAAEHFDKVSCHKRGCVYMNNFIDEMKGLRRTQLLYLICLNSRSLSRDSYGNFVVQHVLELHDPNFVGRIGMMLKGHYVDLSMRKEGSYIVELILKYSNLIEFVVDDFLSSDRILQVASGRFGNYVIQTALKEAMRVDLFLYQRLAMKLQEEDLDSLRFGYGKNVYKFITGCGVPVPQLRFV